MTRAVYRPVPARLPRTIVPGMVRADLGPDLPLQALLEPLDLTGRVDDVLRARVERVAVAADVDAELLAGGPDGPLSAAGAAVDLGVEVLGVDVGLHACAASVSAGMTRTRFLSFFANSNLTLPACVANRV